VGEKNAIERQRPKKEQPKGGEICGEETARDSGLLIVANSGEKGDVIRSAIARFKRMQTSREEEGSKLD